MMRKRWLFLAILLVAVLAGLIWNAHRADDDKPEARYQFATVGRGDVAHSVSANGTLNPVTLVNVGTQVSGTVRRLNADFNDHVTKGQVLLELDPSLLNAQVAQSTASVSNAAATLELAKANEQRSRSLFARTFVSRQDLDNATQALKAAQAQLAQAQAVLAKDRVNLAYTVIRSPVSGVVVNRTVDIGQTVAASFQTPTLFQIAQDLSKMQADTSFAEADIGGIRAGQKARFSVDAFPNLSFQGAVKLIRLNPTTQQNVVTYDVVISVDNPDRVLLPGMTAYVGIVVAQRKDVLLVPNAALRFKLPNAPAPAPGRRSAAAGGRVYVLDGGVIKPVTVTTGISDGRNTEVLSGDLPAGSKVIIADLQPRTEPNNATVRLRMF